MVLSLSCCSGLNDDVIVNVSPFRNLSCDLNAPTSSRIVKQATKFAAQYGFRARSNAFATILTNERLNFIVTYSPRAPLYVTAVAREKPRADEVALFDQFVANLSLKCTSKRD